MPRWIMLTLLALPALLPLLFSTLNAWSAGLVPTGFIQYDMPYYVANAREHFDHGFSLTYGNPYAREGTASIYFQPHIFVLGILQAIGLSPALALNLFGLAAIAAATIGAARLYEELIGFETTAKKIGFLCFFWGGGVLGILGLLLGGNQFSFDPMHGW